MSVSGVNSSNSAAIAAANNSQSQSLSTLLDSTTKRPNLASLLSADESGDGSTSGDILDLSSAGQDAADQLYQLLESVEVSKFQVSADQASGNLQQKLSSALSQAGIDTSQEIDLQLDSSGNVVVSNNNSQAQQIENTINNNPNLKKAVTDYLEFMQAIAPTLENGSSAQTGTSPELGQLLSSSGSSSQGTVTLALQGNNFTTSSVDGNNNPVVLASSRS